MPYIDQYLRNRIDPALNSLIGRLSSACTAGEIAYVVFKLMLFYWSLNPSFSQWAGLRGAIADQIDEFRDRIVKDYECGKRNTNGDVL